MTKDCYDRLLDPDNLYVAYLRARRAIEDYEGLINRQEFAQWDRSLEEHLDRVRDLLKGDPGSIPCHLVPIPKADGRLRAYYWIPLEYQVGWVAIVQAIGPLLDQRMPSWSFAYRLHRPRSRFVDDEATWLWDDYLLKSPSLYLGFAQSWKPFRRYANLTVKRLLGDKLPDDPREEEVRIYEERRGQNKNWRLAPKPGGLTGLDLRHSPFPYLLKRWRTTNPTDRVWFARLDLSKFFPTVRRDEVHRRLMRELTGLPGFDPARWFPLLRLWLRFGERAEGIPAHGLEQLSEERVTSGGLPVGLIASGFLANVYMMEVDRDLEGRLADVFLGEVAVLRYVDDYLILASDREQLCHWLAVQFTVLGKHKLQVNYDKLRPTILARVASGFKKPPEFIRWLGKGGKVHVLPSKLQEDIKKEIKKDPREYWRREGSVTRLDRKEFVSTTLRRMSHRADEDVDLLDEGELDDRILDLTDLAETADDHQEVRPDTLEAFAAAQLQRTPMSSPAVVLEQQQLRRDREETRRAVMQAAGESLESFQARKGRVENQLRELQEHAILRIQERGWQMVRHVGGSFLKNPHKHRLLDRWVRTAAASAEWFEEQELPYQEEVEAFSALLTLQPPRSDEYRWVVSEGDFEPLKPVVLCFLRLRAWSALASCAEDTLRTLAIVRDATHLGTSQWPSLQVRLKRRLKWLTRVARSLRKASRSTRSMLVKQDACIAQLERQALTWWNLFEKLADPVVAQDVFLELLDPAAPGYDVNLVFAQTALLPWTRSWSSEGTRAVAARKALESLAAGLALSRRHLTDLEQHTLREWVLQQPEHRVWPRLLKKMFRATVIVPSYSHDSSTVGWVSDLAWKLAASEKGEAALAELTKTTVPRFEAFVRAVVAQRHELRIRKWSVSIRALFEALHWPDGPLRKPANEPVQAIHEAARVVLLRGILKYVAKPAKRPAVYLSPDNLFINAADWKRIEAEVARGTAPPVPRVRYRLKLPDPMFAIRNDPDDVLIATGLCGVVVAAGQQAGRRMSRVGSRARLVLGSVWNAIESGPALSHSLVRQLATLCAIRHLRTMNKRLRKAYAGLYDTPALEPDDELRVLRSAQTGLEKLSRQLANDSTRREERTLYVVESGLPCPSGTNPLGESLDVTVVQLDLDILSSDAWSVSGATIAFSTEFLYTEAWPRLWRALRAVRASFSEKSIADHQNVRPRVVVFPELSIPRRYVRTLQRFAQAHDAVVVAGIEYRSEPGWASNEAVVAVPAPERHPAAQSRLFWVGKHHPVEKEWEFLQRNGIRFVGTRDFTVIQHPTVGRLGVVICYDLYAVETLVAFQRKVLHLVVPAYNKDLTTFDSLAEAAMRLLFANLILANTGHFGGSLVVAPFYEAYDREMLRVRGQHIDTVERLAVPLAALELEQRQPKWQDQPPPDRASTPQPKKFKTKPADW